MPADAPVVLATSQGRDPDCDRARSRIRMSYQHQFTGLTEGIRPTAPLRWRGLDGLVSAFWEAVGARGGRGDYISANPRISFFFTDVSSLRVTHRSAAARRGGRPVRTEAQQVGAEGDSMSCSGWGVKK